MAQGVDPQRVIQKLAVRIANEIIQNAMNEVALEDAAAASAEQREAVPGKHEMPTGPDAV